MLLLEMNIDKTVPVPLYYQLKSLILSEIKKGNLKEGDCLPTEMQMVEHFHVSRSTVRQAISDLSKEGWLERIASKGTFVTNNTSHSENFIRSFEPFYQQVSRQNKTPSTELLNLQVVPANETLAKKLGIEPGEKLISMFRRRLSDNVPMVTIQNYLPYSLCAFILSEDFTVRSLYELLMTRSESCIHETKSIVSAANASAEDIHLLQVDANTPMLCFHNISRRADGTVLDYAFARYRGDLNKFELIDTPHLHSDQA